MATQTHLMPEGADGLDTGTDAAEADRRRLAPAVPRPMGAWSGSWVPAYVGLGGLVIGWVIFGIGTPHLNPFAPDWPLNPSGDMYVNRQLLVFLTILCTQVALWMVVASAFYWPAVAALKEAKGHERLTLVASAAPPLAFIVLLRPINESYFGKAALEAHNGYLPGQELRMGIVLLVALVSLLPPLICIRVVDQDAARLRQEYDGRPREAMTRLTELRRSLQSHLAALSAMVVMLVLVVESLRRFANAAYLEQIGVPINKDTILDFRLMPQDGIVVYGLLFTLLLALVYMPTHITVAAAGRWLVDTVAPLPDPTSGDLKVTLDRRKSLEELLELKQGPLEMIRASFAVLAPLVATLIGAAIPYAK
jgi:hypothetical protein